MPPIRNFTSISQFHEEIAPVMYQLQKIDQQQICLTRCSYLLVSGKESAMCTERVSEVAGIGKGSPGKETSHCNSPLHAGIGDCPGQGSRSEDPNDWGSTVHPTKAIHSQKITTGQSQKIATRQSFQTIICKFDFCFFGTSTVWINITSLWNLKACLHQWNLEIKTNTKENRQLRC